MTLLELLMSRNPGWTDSVGRMWPGLTYLHGKSYTSSKLRRNGYLVKNLWFDVLLGEGTSALALPHLRLGCLAVL